MFVEGNTDFAEETRAKISKIIDKLNLKEDPSEIVKIVKNSQQSKKRNKAKKNVTPKEPTQSSQANQTKEKKEAPNVNKNQEKEIKRLWQAIDELRGLFEYKKHKNELTGTQIQSNNCQDSPSPTDKRPKKRRQTRTKEQSKSLVEELTSKLVEKENKLNELERKLEDKHQETEDLKKQNDSLKQRILELEKPERKEEDGNKDKEPDSQQADSKKTKPKIVIAGDSILKNLHGWMISRSKSVKVNCFPGATTVDMVSFIQPLIARKPDHIILHIGTNDLAVDSPQEIAQKIVALTKIVTDNGIGCTVSEILKRDDYLSLVSQEVNRLLKQMLPEHIKLVSNDSIKTHHLNRSGLHLNSRGTGALAYNLINCIKNLDFRNNRV